MVGWLRAQSDRSIDVDVADAVQVLDHPRRIPSIGRSLDEGPRGDHDGLKAGVTAGTLFLFALLPRVAFVGVEP